MKEETIADTSQQIIDIIGGSENITELFHCITRLRFYFKDKTKVNIEKLTKLKGVMGAQFVNDQLQIIIGPDVDDYYNEILVTHPELKKESSLEENNDLGTKEVESKKFQWKVIFETLSAIFLPVIPVLAGTGMLKGVLILITSYTKISANAGPMLVLNMAADTVFYFFPFFLAWSAAKRFKTDIPISLALAGILLYPTMTAGLAAGKSGIDFFGLTIPYVKYASTSIPIILTVWFLSYLYPRIDKILPKSIRLVFAPMFTVLIMVPIELLAIAPLANYISLGLATIVTWLFKVSPLLAGAVVGATRPLVVLTGMHLSLGVVAMQNLAKYGYDVLLPVNTMGTLAMVGASFGTWYKSKNKATKEVAMPAFISAVIGITEPTIYGLLVKFKSVLIATMISGGVAGAFVAFFGGHASAYVNSCLLSLPVFAGKGFIYVVIGMIIAAVMAFVLVQVLGVSGDTETSSDTSPMNSSNIKTATDFSSAIISDKKEITKGATIFSPLSGQADLLENTSDKVFSSGMMGKGLVITPDKEEIYAPFDGTISALPETNHAIGINSTDGVELLIHMGIDTVNLKGKYFDLQIQKGQKVKKGDLLGKVDFKQIQAAGYDITTPIIVTNMNDFLDVITLKEGKHVSTNDKIIETITE